MADAPVAEVGGTALRRAHRRRGAHALFAGRPCRGERIRDARASAQLLAQRPHGGRERVDHRLLALLRGAELDDAGEGSIERIGELGPVELGRVSERAAGPPQGSAPQRAARSAHRRDERGARGDQQATRRRRVVRRLELRDHRAEPAIHVRAVIGVTDRRVELGQVVALLPNRGCGLRHPSPNRLRVHARPSFHRPLTPPSEAQPCARARPRARSARRRARGA